MKPRKKYFLLWLLAVFVGLAALGIFGAQQSAGAAAPLPQTPAGSAMTSPHFRLAWSTIASGAGVYTSAHFALSSTIGQSNAAIQTGSTHFEACTGFWCGAVNFIRKLFLPLVIKS